MPIVASNKHNGATNYAAIEILERIIIYFLHVFIRSYIKFSQELKRKHLIGLIYIRCFHSVQYFVLFCSICKKIWMIITENLFIKLM